MLVHEIGHESPDVGVQLLVEAVRQGHQDPWDLDVVAVTDAYLAAIDRMEHRDLQVSGRLFLYAAILIRLKAEFMAREFDLLVRDDEALELVEGEEGLGPEEDDEAVRRLPPELRVFPRPRRPRRRAVTLFDLIEALQRCEELEKRRLSRPARDKRDVIVASAHQDDLGSDIVTIRDLVMSAFEDRDEAPFDEFVDAGLSATTCYMAFLFLTANKEVDMNQTRWYEDLTISRGIN